MQGPSYFSLFNILLHGKSSAKFILGVIVSFSFSIAVILGTVGIMDGFDDALKKGLRAASGDLMVYHRDGFFHFKKEAEGQLRELGVREISPMIQTEGFLVYGESSKGVVIKGVEPESLGRVTGLHLSLQGPQIAIGKELAQQLKLKIGDPVTLVFATGSGGISTLPLLKRFVVNQVLSHGIYKKDLRYVYIRDQILSQILSVGEKVNLVSLKVPSQKTGDPMEDIREFEVLVKQALPEDFVTKPFWREFDPLIEAVQVEKFSIGLILQLVVIISIFNILAFVIFLNEKRSKEIFLLEALGASKNMLSRVWIMLILLIWVVSCFFSVALSRIFDWGLRSSSFLQMPGEIYNLSRLSLKLEFSHYFWVFALALFWELMIAMVGILRLKKKSILSGLRKEFS